MHVSEVGEALPPTEGLGYFSESGGHFLCELESYDIGLGIGEDQVQLQVKLCRVGCWTRKLPWGGDAGHGGVDWPKIRLRLGERDSGCFAKCAG